MITKEEKIKAINFARGRLRREYAGFLCNHFKLFFKIEKENEEIPSSIGSEKLFNLFPEFLALGKLWSETGRLDYILQCYYFNKFTPWWPYAERKERLKFLTELMKVVKSLDK